ncbi:chorismate synthase, partial [Campylobacter jejuni]
GNNLEFELKGRHDPCVGVRGSVVASAMVRLVLADCLLLNASANLNNLKNAYGLK